MKNLEKGLVVELKRDLIDGIELVAKGNDGVILDSWREEGREVYELEIIGLEETGSWKVTADEVKVLEPRTYLEPEPSSLNPMPFTEEQKRGKIEENQYVKSWDRVKKFFIVKGSAGTFLELLWDNGEIHIFDSVARSQDEVQIKDFLASEANTTARQARSSISGSWSFELLKDYVSGKLDRDLFFYEGKENDKGENIKEAKEMRRNKRRKSRSKRIAQLRETRERRKLNEMDRDLQAELEGIQSSMRDEVEKPADRFDPEKMKKYLRTWEEVRNRG